MLRPTRASCTAPAPRLRLHDGDDRYAGGLTLLLLGILLEYTSILVLRAHGKPLFFAIDLSSDAVLARALESIEHHKEGAK